MTFTIRKDLYTFPQTNRESTWYTSVDLYRSDSMYMFKIFLTCPIVGTIPTFFWSWKSHETGTKSPITEVWESAPDELEDAVTSKRLILLQRRPKKRFCQKCGGNRSPKMLKLQVWKTICIHMTPWLRYYWPTWSLQAANQSGQLFPWQAWLGGDTLRLNQPHRIRNSYYGTPYKDSLL